MARNGDGISETSPLLATGDQKPPTPDSHVNEVEELTPQEKWQQFWRTWKVTVLCGICVFVADFGSCIVLPPVLRHFELMICREYYMKHNPSAIGDNGNVPENLCKKDAIASDFALLRGWLSVLEGIAAVIVAVPFGVMADKYGRRLISTIGLVGELLTLGWQYLIFFRYDLFGSKALLTSAIFRLIGGGSPVITAIIMAMIADSLPDERRAQAFYYLTAFAMLGELVGTPLASLLMSITSIWVPTLLGFGICWLAVPILWLVPETSPSTMKTPGATVVDEEEVPDDEPETSSWSSIVHRQWRSAVSECNKIGLLLFHNRNVVLGLIAFLTSRLSPQLVNILPQYVSKRYNWSLAKASLLIPFRDVIELVLLMVLLPALTQYQLNKLRLSAPRVDAKITRYSVLALAFGAFLCGVAVHPVFLLIGVFFFTMGTGYRASLQSFLSASVPKASLATLFVTVGVVDTVGTLIAAPTLAFSLAKGIGIGRGIGGPNSPGGGPGHPPALPGDDDVPDHVSKWIGLPYLIASAAFVVMGACTLALNVEKAEAHGEANRSDREGSSDSDA